MHYKNLSLTDIISEEWKTIHGYKFIYQISNFGRVKSFAHKKIKILRQSKNHKGYLMTYLYLTDGNKKSISTHRLVAKHFIDDMDNLQVNHINGDKNDNTATNLEWTTCKENIQHAINIGLRTNWSNLKSTSIFSSEDLVTIREMINNNIGNQEISAIYNCHHSTISKIRTGKHYPQ
jgi:hypothetical protein